VNNVDPLGLQSTYFDSNYGDISSYSSPQAYAFWGAVNQYIGEHMPMPGNGIAGSEMEGVFAGMARDNPKLAQLMKEAEDLYPKKCGKIEDHHNTPKYLGGDPNGPTTPLPAPYHQLITNAFRNLAPYGEEVPDSQSVQNIVNQVYSQYPLPK
jgi:hypothetical protein